MLFRLRPFRLFRGGFRPTAAVLLGVLLLLSGATRAEKLEIPHAAPQQGAIVEESLPPSLELAPASGDASAPGPQARTPSRSLPIAGGIGWLLALALIVLAGANSRKRWPKELRFGKA